jgi:hypothetical protein
MGRLEGDLLMEAELPLELPQQLGPKAKRRQRAEDALPAAPPADIDVLFKRSPLLNGGVPSPTPGPQKMRLDWLSIPEYQRAPSPQKVARIANNWDLRQLGQPVVSYRDGKYWIVDGYRRWLAAKLVHQEFLWCTVHLGMTREEEAELFTKLATERTNLSAADKQKARIFAGDKTALAVSQLIAEAGLAQQTNSEGKSVVGCVATIYRIHQHDPDRGVWLIKFLGVAAAADRIRRGIAPPITMHLVEALAPLHAVPCIHDNQEDLAGYFGSVVGLAKATAKLMTIAATGAPRSIELAELLEYDRKSTNRMINRVEVAAVLAKRPKRHKR